MKSILFSALLLLSALTFALADGPSDNLADKVRPVPPPGVKVPDDVRAELSAGVRSLGTDISKLHMELKSKPDLSRLLPDVEIFHKAVDWALRYDEFFKTNEFKTARALLQEGHARAAALRDGEAPWLTATGAVARGYVSRIDGSVQPFGLVIPPGMPSIGLAVRWLADLGGYSHKKGGAPGAITIGRGLAHLAPAVEILEALRKGTRQQ